MKTKLLLIIFLITGMLFPILSNGQNTSEKEKFDNLSSIGLNSAWANRTIVEVVFDKETIIASGILDSMELLNMVNTGMPEQQYQRGKKFIDILLDGVIQGKFKTCDYLTGSPMTTAQAKGICSHIDSVRIPIPNPPYEKDTVELIEINREQVVKYRVMIDWFYDASKFSIKTKIIAIAPLRKYYNYSGVFVGYSPLFWILI